MIDWSQYLDASHCRSSATPTAIAEAENQLGLEFPREYAECLKFTNGFEGFIGKSDGNYLRLWQVEELVSANEGYQTSTWAPGLLLFGTNGGGEAFGFDRRTPRHPIVMIPFIPMEWKEARPMGNTFSEFLQLMSEGKF